MQYTVGIDVRHIKTFGYESTRGLLQKSFDNIIDKESIRTRTRFRLTLSDHKNVKRKSNRNESLRAEEVYDTLQLLKEFSFRAITRN